MKCAIFECANVSVSISTSDLDKIEIISPPAHVNAMHASKELAPQETKSTFSAFVPKE
jgi:hypothetical protein